MKYKYLVPIALLGLLILGVFTTMKNNREKEEQYATCLEQARQASDFEIYIDAEAYYAEALEIRKDLDVYNELVEVYYAHEKPYDAEMIAEEALDEFPKDGRAYAICASAYERNNRYPEIRKIYLKYKKNNLVNEDMERIYENVRWLYTENGIYTDVDNYSSGLCAACLEDGMWGYINHKGKRTIKYAYKTARPFIRDITPVETMNGIWYFIDLEGNKKKVLDKIENVKEIGYVCDAIPVYNGETWGYYDNDQKLLIEGYDEALTMANGYAAVRIGSDWYLVDIAGNKLRDQAYTAIVCDDKMIAYRGFYFAQLNGVYNLYNSEGGVVGSDSYQDAHMFNSGGKYAAVKLDGKWGFIDTTGTIVIEPQYEDARSFANGAAAVKIKGKWGYIDESGKVVIEPIFQDAKDLTDEGTILVNDCGTWQLLKLRVYEE